MSQSGDSESYLFVITENQSGALIGRINARALDTWVDCLNCFCVLLQSKPVTKVGKPSRLCSFSGLLITHFIVFVCMIPNGSDLILKQQANYLADNHNFNRRKLLSDAS